MNDPDAMNRDRSGSYLLVIALDGPKVLSIGALGEHHFPAGTYIYCGSALNGLRQRTSRHMREIKKVHWHVDRLLNEGRVVGAILLYSEQRLECRLASTLADMKGMRTHVPGFGSSDCRCPGHLLLADLEELEERWLDKVLKVSSGP